jgi:hypothetical protein
VGSKLCSFMMTNKDEALDGEDVVHHPSPQQLSSDLCEDSCPGVQPTAPTTVHN